MARGGYRKGAGRPTGTGKFKEDTKPVRIPISKVELVKRFIEADNKNAEDTLPLFGSSVQAGLPTPADEHIDAHINIHNYVVENEAETFLLRAKGQSMQNAGIDDGDLLVVDKSITPRNGHIVIAAVDGDLTVKRLNKLAHGLQLLPENSDYSPINVTEEQSCHIWGVVTSVIHKV